LAAATSRAARLAGAALAALLALAAPAGAQDDVASVAAALRADHVYVSPDAELAGQVDADALRERVRTAGASPTFIAVLPSSAVDESPGRTLVALREATGERGTYALVVGNEVRTLSDFYDGAAAAGDQARAAHPDDLQAALAAFIDTTGRERPEGGGSSAGALFALLVLGAVLAGGVFLVTRRKRERRVVSTVREEDVDEDFVRLGDAIRAAEIDISLTEDSVAKADYQRALNAYDRANELHRSGDESAANRALDEGQAAIHAAQERLAGRLPKA
jgi:hypothetical protein